MNINGRLLSLEKPVVMGILNVTPDSFFAGSRKQHETVVTGCIETIISEGGAIIDIGGYSTRPNAIDVTPEEEWSRVEPALKIWRNNYSMMPASIDTFRADIAKRAIREYGVSIINDISGGAMDEKMFETAATLNVPYILTHYGSFQETPQSVDNTQFQEDVMMYFAKKLRTLRLLGVNDVILDPGFGFGKTLEQNYALLRNLRNFGILFDCPLLVGVSRKSMIYKLLESAADESMNGTTVLHTYALLNGANILRVHDVRAAVEAIKLVDKIKK